MFRDGHCEEISAVSQLQHLGFLLSHLGLSACLWCWFLSLGLCSALLLVAQKDGVCHGNGAGFLQPPVFPVTAQAAAIWLGWDAGTGCCGTALRSHRAVFVRSQKNPSVLEAGSEICLLLSGVWRGFAWEKEKGSQPPQLSLSSWRRKREIRMRRSLINYLPFNFSLLYKKLNPMSAVFSTSTVHCASVSGRATVGVQTAGAHRAFPGDEDRRACDFRGGEG